MKPVTCCVLTVVGVLALVVSGTKALGEAVFDANLSMTVQFLPAGLPIRTSLHEIRLIEGESDGFLTGAAVSGPMILPDQVVALGASVAGDAEWDGITPAPAQTSGVMANKLGVLFNRQSTAQSGIARVMFNNADLNASVDAPSGEEATASLRLHALAGTGITGVPSGYLFSHDIETTPTTAAVNVSLSPTTIDVPFTIEAGPAGSLGLFILVAQAGGSAVSAFDGINVFTSTLPEPDVPLADFTEIPEPTALCLFGFGLVGLVHRRGAFAGSSRWRRPAR